MQLKSSYSEVPAERTAEPAQYPLCHADVKHGEKFLSDKVNQYWPTV